MTKIKISLSAALLTATATAILFTCEKAPDYCGTNELYEPSCEFCFGSKAYPRCSKGNAKYNPLTNGCDTTTGLVGTRCSDGSVVPSGTPCGGYTLTVAAAPEIGGTLVTPTLPKGPTFIAEQPVTLIATSNSEYEFAGWAGAQPFESRPAGNMTTATYKMGGSMPQVTIVAMFKPKAKGKLATDVFPEHGGEITRDPDKEIYGSEESVTVTAAPKPDYAFAGWSGASTSKDPAVTIQMDDGKTLVAMFTPVVHTLKAEANPSNGGAVFINGTAQTGNASQEVGTDIWVLAGEAEGYRFKEWSGTSVTIAEPNNLSTRVTLSANATITANFERGNGIGTGVTQAVVCTLAVERNPAGGSVTLNPDLPVYNIGMNVTATAAPEAGQMFTGWTGSAAADMADSKTNPATIKTMAGRMTLSANFQTADGSVTPSLDTAKVQFTVNVNATVTAASGNSTVQESVAAFQHTVLHIPLSGAKESWRITVSADGYVDTAYTLVLTRGDNAWQNITLRRVPPTNVNKCTSAELCKKTDKIGGQIWMAENLNIYAKDSWCYDDDPVNCDRYGRLYTWDAAKTACPAGWHLSTREDWDSLASFVGGGTKGAKGEWPYAGKKLKAKSGWDNYQGQSGNGTDDFEFSALPGGLRRYSGFDNAGNNGFWWTATEGSGGYAYYRSMAYHGDFVGEDSYNKSFGSSVRCVEDVNTIPTPATYYITFDANGGSGAPPPAKTDVNGKLASLPTPVRSGYTFEGWYTASTGGTKIEAGHTFTANATVYAQWTAVDNYEFVLIGGKKWMSKNLNIETQTANSWCYNNSPDSCAKYGRLYTWDAAKKVCPAGWHLSTREEWDSLASAVGGTIGTMSSFLGSYREWVDAGKKLKSKTGWNYSSGISSTDEFGFSALPGGARILLLYGGTLGTSYYDFSTVGEIGNWWTPEGYDNGNAYQWGMFYDTDNVGEISADKSFGLSVRCVADK